MPKDQRTDNVVPIFKEGSDPGNYRLLSLMSILGKIIEWLSLNSINKGLETKNIINAS